MGIRSAPLLVMLAGCSFFLSEPSGGDGDGDGDGDVDGGDPEAWWDTSFSARREVVIDNTGRPALAGFPVLVRVPMLGADRVAADGAGARFVASDQTTELAYEIERWDSLGESQVWVRVDLPDDDLISIWMYYGAANKTNASDGAAVFTDYFGVYHFTGFFDASTPVPDVTGNGNDLTRIDNMEETNPNDGVAGVVGRAARFDEGQDELMETTGPVSSFVVDQGEQKMWEAWFRPSPANAGAHVIMDNEDNEDGVSIVVDETGSVRGSFYAGSEHAAETDELYDDQMWHHAAFTIDRQNNTAELIIDGGAEVVPASLPALDRNGGANLRIGEDFDLAPQQFDGDIDEVRIGPLRSPEWIAATHATVTTEMALVGEEQRLSSP